MVERFDVAVIGAGAKAAAIAAKAWCLNTVEKADISITIYDPNPAGSAWSGRFGYTDGAQSICTPAERDFGFPYDRASHGADVATLMSSQFSWQAFTLDPNAAPDVLYADWVARGRRPPLHRDYAIYIAWAIERSGVQPRPERVIAINWVDGINKWEIVGQALTGASNSLFDAVIITGTGRSRRESNPIPGSSPFVSDGRTFWLQDLEKLRKDLIDYPANRSVLIIGAGGTAAAVAGWFLRSQVPEIEINIVGREATLHTRAPGFFEDRLFTDDEEWRRLPPDAQDAFITRLTKGVVWQEVAELLTANRDITYTCDDIDLLSDRSAGGLLEVVARGGLTKRVFSGSYVVDCRGFDAWSFLDLLDATTRTKLPVPLTPMDRVDDSLMITGVGFPKNIGLDFYRSLDPHTRDKSLMEAMGLVSSAHQKVAAETVDALERERQLELQRQEAAQQLAEETKKPRRALWPGR